MKPLFFISAFEFFFNEFLFLKFKIQKNRPVASFIYLFKIDGKLQIILAYFLVKHWLLFHEGV